MKVLCFLPDNVLVYHFVLKCEFFDSALCGPVLGLGQVSVEERAVLKGTVEGTAGVNAARPAQTRPVSCC